MRLRGTQFVLAALAASALFASWIAPRVRAHGFTIHGVAPGMTRQEVLGVVGLPDSESPVAGSVWSRLTPEVNVFTDLVVRWDDRGAALEVVGEQLELDHRMLCGNRDPWQQVVDRLRPWMRLDRGRPGPQHLGPHGVVSLAGTGTRLGAVRLGDPAGPGENFFALGAGLGDDPIRWAFPTGLPP